MLFLGVSEHRGQTCADCGRRLNSDSNGANPILFYCNDGLADIHTTNIVVYHTHFLPGGEKRLADKLQKILLGSYFFIDSQDPSKTQPAGGMVLRIQKVPRPPRPYNTALRCQTITVLHRFLSDTTHLRVRLMLHRPAAFCHGPR